MRLDETHHKHTKQTFDMMTVTGKVQLFNCSAPTSSSDLVTAEAKMFSFNILYIV